MKTLLALSLAFLVSFTTPNTAKASDIATSVVAGVVVAHYAGTLAGVAVSLVLAGGALVTGKSRKEAIANAALNDVNDFYLNGKLSVALENTINSLKIIDPSVSDSEALDLIVESTAIVKQ